MRPEQLPLRRTNGMRVHPVTRWHRALGIASTLIVIVTVLTGLTLNDGQSLGLSEGHPHNALVDRLYRQSAASVPQGFETPRGWVTQLGAQTYLDTQPIAQHDTPLIGALVRDDMLLIAYRDGLVQYDDKGQLVESYGALDGLPPPLSQLGGDAKAVAVETASGVLYFDRTGQGERRAERSHDRLVNPARLPRELKASLADAYRGSGVTYERVLLDLHSGRLFGRVGGFRGRRRRAVSSDAGAVRRLYVLQVQTRRAAVAALSPAQALAAAATRGAHTGQRGSRRKRMLCHSIASASSSNRRPVRS